MITDFNKSILLAIDFANRYLTAKSRFVKDDKNHKAFTKTEIMSVLKELHPDSRFLGLGGYEIMQKYKAYNFQLYIRITRNVPLLYIYVYVNSMLREDSPSNIAMYLHHVPYDKNLINNNFALNSLDDLRLYLKEMLEIFNDYIDEYIKEIEIGNIPDASPS